MSEDTQNRFDELSESNEVDAPLIDEKTRKTQIIAALRAAGLPELISQEEASRSLGFFKNICAAVPHAATGSLFDLDNEMHELGLTGPLAALPVWYIRLPDDWLPDTEGLANSYLDNFCGTTQHHWAKASFINIPMPARRSARSADGFSSHGVCFIDPWMTGGTSPIQHAYDAGGVVAVFHCAGTVRITGYSCGEEVLIGLQAVEGQTYRYVDPFETEQELRHRIQVWEETGVNLAYVPEMDLLELDGYWTKRKVKDIE